MSKVEKSNNIIDYLAWRGDIPLSESPFNELDALILSQLSYLHLEGIASDDFKKMITIEKLADKFFKSDDFEKRSANGPFINTKTVELLKVAGTTRRFKNVEICAFKDDLNFLQEKQFSAYTAFLEDKTVFVAFRGTHNEIVGWKEDFNMAYETPVPAQIEAADYLDAVAKNTRGDIRIGGHSKGGNLAMYAAAFCDSKTKKRIIGVFNNDGQGFSDKVLDDPKFIEIIPLIHSFSPESSVVGMLLEHRGEFTFIQSDTDSLLFQHDPFTWQVLGKNFVTVKERSNESVIFDKTMKGWLEQMDMKRREEFVDTLFDFFKASGATTLSELQDNWLKSSPKIIKFLHELDEQKKKDLLHGLKLFFESAKIEIKQTIVDYTEKKF